ncbi:MAG: hypothetical protein JOY99_09130 [Sphingomonadaceae bacterium]|nr:hypothetical protein [Sphingomonadaceae bacterium]
MLLASLVLATALPAAADADLRCFITTAVIAGNADAGSQPVAMESLLYWLGRLDAQMDDETLKRRVAAEVGKMTQAEFQADAQRCGTEIKTRGAAVQDLGQAIQNSAKSPVGK